MKKQFTLLFLILAVMCYFSSTSYAQKLPKTKTIVGDVLQVPKCTEAPTIDGKMDPVWKNVTAVPLTKFEGATGDSLGKLKDHAADFRLMWDPKFLYVFVSVVDDSLYGGNISSPWLNDCVEMFFDGNNEKATSYDANDVQWRWVWNETVANHPAGNGRGDWKWLKTTTGYNFEIRIAKDSLGAYAPLKDDQEIGFEISNGDAESANGRDDVLHWWTTNGLTWNNPSLFGTAVLTANEVSSVLNIPYASQAPKIDGTKNPGEWDAANELSLNQIEGGDTVASAVFAGIRDWKDHTAYASLLWDEKFLYAFVEVIDDSLYGGNVSSPWLNDCVEMFFDGSNEKATSYDANDVQWRWVYGETVANHPAGNGRGDWVWKKTAVGYNFEIKIAKDSLGAFCSLKADQEIGFELSNGDAESAAGRDEVRHWWTDNGLTWNNPSLFGTAVLRPSTTGVEKTKATPLSYRLDQNYPNPFNPTTKITFSTMEPGQVTLRVYNTLGQEVATLINQELSAGTYKADFNAMNLPSGVYIYKLEAGDQSFAKKMMLLK